MTAHDDGGPQDRKVAALLGLMTTTLSQMSEPR
jgi:DNA-binding transcriptional regulator YdaS (Cro superfamily)